MAPLLNTWRQMGFLRNLLHGTAATLTLLMPLARGPDYPGFLNLFFTGVLPATAPIVVIVIGLDILMSVVWRSDTRNPERIRHLSQIIRAHQIFGGALLLTWLLVFLPVLV